MSVDRARNLVKTIAGGLSAKQPSLRAQIWDLVKARYPVPYQRKAMGYAMWLVKTGTTDLEVIGAILQRAQGLRGNFFAYFAPGREARGSISNSILGARASVQSQQYKNEELEFLKGLVV